MAGINLSTSDFGLQLIDFEPEVPHVCVENFRSAPLAVLWTVPKLEWASKHLIVGLT